MKFLAKTAVAVAAFCLVSSPAWANDQLFAFSGPSNGITLTLNGTTVLSASGSGWYNSDGIHNADNGNYFVGSYNGKYYNNFFVFDLGSITSPVTSAVFSAPRFTSVYGSGDALRFSLYNVSAPIQTLLDSHTGAEGVAIFKDLGSGPGYGSQTFSTAQSYTPVALTFNSGGLSSLNQARGSTFAFGGSLNIGAVPEPATWAMMLIGFGLVGGAMRYRRRSTEAVLA